MKVKIPNYSEMVKMCDARGWIFERTSNSETRYELCSNDPKYIGTTHCYATLAEAWPDVYSVHKNGCV